MTDLVPYTALADRLFDVLPAPSQAEIARRLGITTRAVGQLLMQVRKHSAELGWTVPHARRGDGRDGQDRFFAALIDKNGNWEDERSGEEIEAGARGTLQEASAKQKHMANGLTASAGHLKSPKQRRRMLELAEDARYLSRRCQQLLIEGGG